MNNKTAIVIGATGLVGASLVKMLGNNSSFSKIITITRREMLPSSTTIENHVVDFDHLTKVGHLFKGDILFSCLGTTVKKAGSINHQRVVDLDYQYEAAKLASEQGVKRYLLVSASGADANSYSQYMKMKGELEDKVQQLNFDHISILQPSLLLGDREELRIGESMAALIMPMLCKLPLLKAYRPIQGSEVAEKMIKISNQSNPALFIKLDSIFS